MHQGHGAYADIFNPVEVTGLYVNREAALGVPESHKRIGLVMGRGVAGDSYADLLSPMQVLITSQEALQSFGLQPESLGRNNILLSGWPLSKLRSGDMIRLGEGALRVTYGCEDCAVRGTRRGQCVYAAVVRGGAVSAGDSAVLVKERFPELPQTRYERLLWFVQQVPRGKVVTYDHAVRAMGGTRAHFRSLPQYIKKAASSSQGAASCIHRIVDSHRRATPHVTGHAGRLEAEGIALDRAGRVLEADLWNPEPLFGSYDALEP